MRIADCGINLLVPAFYNKPSTLDEVTDHAIGKILDLFEIEHMLFRGWERKK